MVTQKKVLKQDLLRFYDKVLTVPYNQELKYNQYH